MLDYGESLLIQCAQEAQAHGVHRWIASIWTLLWTPQFAYKGAAALIPFCQQLQQLGIMPVALYLLDEPDARLGASAATAIPKAAADARKACPGPAIAAIYQTKPLGMQALDWVGDDQATAPDQLQKLPKITAGQRYIIVPYGSTPWQRDPTPYVEFAATHAVAAVLAFAWATFGQNEGISVDGQASAYLSAGCRITGLC